jgi:hypothetical protein
MAIYELGEHDKYGSLVWHQVEKPLPLHRVIHGAICSALAFTDGRQDTAAKLLGVTPRVMNYLMKSYGIPRPMDEPKLKPCDVKTEPDIAVKMRPQNLKQRRFSQSLKNAPA